MNRTTDDDKVSIQDHRHFGSVWYEHRNVILLVIVAVTTIILSSMYLIWSTLIQKQLHFLQNSTFFTNWYPSLWNASQRKTSSTIITPQDPFRMVRCRDTIDDGNILQSSTTRTAKATATTPAKTQMLTLNPDFVTYCQTWKQLPQQPQQQQSQPFQVMSLGEYISQLRPYLASTNSKNDISLIPQWLEGEIQAALTVALFSTLGPQWGTAILPTLGLNLMQTTIRKIVSMISTYLPNFDETNDDSYSNTTKKNATARTTSGTTTEDSDRNDTMMDDLNDLISNNRNDYSQVPLSISTMSTGAELNYQQDQRKKQQQHQQKKQQRNTNPTIHHRTSSLDLLRMGEVGYSISFGSDNHSDLHRVPVVVKQPARSKNVTAEQECTSVASLPTSTTKQDALPNPFILSEHWYTTIQDMEIRIQQQGRDGDKSSSPIMTYDPWSYRMQPPPKLIDKRFFPDLYIGYGDNVSCTHNQRQILCNRLMSTLLNRLAYNIYIDTIADSQCIEPHQKYFNVQISMDQKDQIQRPCDLIQALIDHGHEVRTSIQTQPTTFGMALCVKEPPADETDVPTWTNIPFGYFLQTGLSDRNGNEAYVCLPHSGLSLEISSGPMLNSRDDNNDNNNTGPINIQHYMAIEGLCGWHSNHTANVPWICSVTSPNTIRQNYHVLNSVRIAALQAIIINTVGTKYDLPYGGYGLTGVCNDSAAQIECAISKDGTTTHIYPLSFQGKFAMHTLRVANDLRQKLLDQCRSSSSTYVENQHAETDIEAIDCLIRAIISLPSDTNTAPISNMIHQYERYLHCCSGGSPLLATSTATATTAATTTATLRSTTTNAATATTTTTTNTNADVSTIVPPVFQLQVESYAIIESIQSELSQIYK